jgi:hypothetical protein
MQVAPSDAEDFLPEFPAELKEETTGKAAYTFFTTAHS